MAFSDYNVTDKILFQLDLFPFTDKLVRYTLRRNKNGVYYLFRESDLYERPKKDSRPDLVRTPPAKLIYIMNGEEAYDEMITRYKRYHLYKSTYWAWKCQGFVWEKLDGYPTQKQFLSFNTGQEETMTLGEITNKDVYGESFTLDDEQCKVYRAYTVTYG